MHSGEEVFCLLQLRWGDTNGVLEEPHLYVFCNNLGVVKDEFICFLVLCIMISECPCLKRSSVKMLIYFGALRVIFLVGGLKSVYISNISRKDMGC